MKKIRYFDNNFANNNIAVEFEGSGVVWRSLKEELDGEGLEAETTSEPYEKE